MDIDGHRLAATMLFFTRRYRSENYGGPGRIRTTFCGSPFDADSFFRNQDLIADAEAVGFHKEAFDGLFVRFVS